jgi:hypothetical protein
VLDTDSSPAFPVADENRTFGRIVSWGALIGVLAMTVAGATIWLLLTDPMSITSAIDRGEVGPLVRAIHEAMAGLLEYL